jgi:ribosomal protein S18 acetylase RimI-like enzyme
MLESVCFTSIPWETRNLGVQSFTLSESFLNSFDKKKFDVEIENLIKHHKNLFVQIRLSKDQLKHVISFQKIGFYYVETTLVPFTQFSRNRILQEFSKNPVPFLPSRYDFNDVKVVAIKKLEKSSVESIKSIAKESFTDDRFHLDPNCPQSVADERFAFWVDDLASDDLITFYTIYYKNISIGFMIRKGESLILAGFSKEYISVGLGDFLWLSTLLDMQQNGFVKTNTLISANNTAVLNLYTRLGFKFKDPCVTLHYWHGPKFE